MSLVPRVDRTFLLARSTASLGWPAVTGSGPAVTGDDVVTAADRCRRLLEPMLSADWAVPVPGLDFSVAGVVANAAQAALWYSVDMWSGRENAAFEVAVVPEASNERLLTSLAAAASALASGVDSAPPGTRGFHPFGSPDPVGFAAMACDELLVHGDDAARGLGFRLDHDEDLAGRRGTGAPVPLAHRRPRRRPAADALVGQRADRSRGQAAPGSLALALRAARGVGRYRSLGCCFVAARSSCPDALVRCRWRCHNVVEGK